MYIVCHGLNYFITSTDGLSVLSQLMDVCFVCAADQNDCYQRPCLNGGTCVDMFQSYRCECPRNFNGTNCEEDLASKSSVPWFYLSSFCTSFFCLLLSSLFMCAFVVQSVWTVKKLFNKCLIQMGSWTWSAFCICFDDTCMYFPQNCMNVILHCSWCFDETSKQITCLQDSLVVHYSFSGHLLVCRLFLGQLDYALLIFRTAWLCISGFQDILDMHCLFSGHLC